MKYTKGVSKINMSGQTPNSKFSRNSQVKFKSDSTALKYKTNSIEEQIDDMDDSDEEDDGIKTNND